MEKAVLFDLDGTLLDTVHDIADKVNSALSHFGFAVRTLDEIKQRIGNGSEYLVRNSLPEGVKEELFQEVFSYFKTLYSGEEDPKTCPFNGIKQVVKTIIERGYRVVIVTNKPQPATDKICKEQLSDIPFDKIVGQSNGVKCKPDKMATEQILKEFNVEKQNAYFVGDGEADVQVAINAGVNGISVLWGYRTKEQLEKVGATVFAKTPQDLLKLIP
jgi:phosphoglycolate phosphatase